MSNDRLDKLISQCKNSDVELKLDAVTKLQVEFETSVEIVDPEPVIAVLKACLRIANQHLTTATLSAIPPLLPLIIHRQNGTPNTGARPFSSSSSTSSSTGSSHDISVLRHVMSSFLPSPGVFERLGDGREKAREKARETLVIIGGFAFRSSPSSTSKLGSGKGPEPPILIFERFLRDNGLSSKVWRVREQSIMVLVNIRRAHHTFPIRPYLSLLVDALEDTDGNVRACATPSIVELFTGPGVTDAARADLKKEMTKKGVRKAIVDNVLGKLMNTGRSTGASTPMSEGSENGDAGTKKEYIPPSLMLQNRRPTVGAPSVGPPAATPIVRAVSHGNVKEQSRPASRTAMVISPPPSQSSNEAVSAVEPAFIASARDLENEFAAMMKAFEGKETEHNWAARERGIQRVRGMLKGDIHTRYPDVFFQCLKDGFIQASLKTLASLRTTVSANTCSMYVELATALGTGIDPFCETIFTNLLRMAGFTKKIIAQQSQQALSSVIQHASAHPRILLPLLWNTLQEKIVQSRAYAIGHIKAYLEVHGHRSKSYIESAGGLEVLERSIKKALGDPNPAVRESARGTFWVFGNVWHDRATVLIEALDATARKQLEKVCPDLNVAVDLPPTTPSSKKSSVATAIAASRAKAKAIATAPPTLMHQATSTSRTAGAASPPSRGISSPSGKYANDRSSPTPVSRSSFSPRSSLSPSTPPRPRILSNNAPMPRSVSTSMISASHARAPSDSVPTVTADVMRRRTSSPFASPFRSPARSSAIRNASQGVLTTSNSDPSHVRHAPPFTVPIPVRQSIAMPDLNDQDSLLLATTIPIPDDSDSDMDESANVLSFSTPFELYPPPSIHALQPPSFSPSSCLSTPNTLSNAFSDSPGKSDPTSVEDALRVRAEQAQSAAERLLELTDPDAEDNAHSVIPSSLLLGSSSVVTPKPPKMPAVPKIKKSLVPPVTPDSRNAAIFRQAALFKNTPVNGRKPSEPLVKPLQDQSHENGWWSKRVSIIERGTPLKGIEPGDRVEELQEFVTALEDDSADIRVLQKLALLCSTNPIPADTASPLSPRLGLPSSPSPFISIMRTLPPVVPDMWTRARSFDRLFDGLLKFLDPTKDAQQLEYALIVVWEILGNQAAFLEGREGELFSALFRVRYCNAIDVLEATRAIRDALCSRIEPVYGLTTMHSSLRSFLAEPMLDVGVKAGSYAFGLIALGKFILRLPTEVLEEELPRLKQTLIAALNDTATLVVREAAYAAIIASQLVLHDETHLFALLDGLDDNKKNLLTYYFEKHGARELDFSSGSMDAVGMTKLESQMGRLDKMMNTPLKERQSSG